MVGLIASLIIFLPTPVSDGDGDANRENADVHASTARERAGVDAECLPIVPLYVNVDGARHVRAHARARSTHGYVGGRAVR